MIFIRIVATLFAAAVCAQALYVPNVLYTRDLEHSRDVSTRGLSERGLHHLDAIRDLAERENVLVLAARDLATLEIRSEDVLSHLIVARMVRTPSPGPYECKTKADCQKKIDYANHQAAEAKKFVDKWLAELKKATKANDDKAINEAKANLDASRGSREHWLEEEEEYKKMMAQMKS